MKIDVVLRDVQDNDLPIFYNHQMEKAACQMAAFPPRNREAFIEHWSTKILGEKTVIKKTILFNGVVAGHIVGWEKNGNRELGYWIGKEYWGNGVATMALSEFLSILNVRPLFAHVAKHNIGSLKVLEKCGFTINGKDKLFYNNR